MLILTLLFMLIAANGAPVMAKRILRNGFDAPIDGGRQWRDHRPVFGNSKTWRGLISACLASALVSWAVGIGLLFGFGFGLFAMIGDLISSFVKRRRGLASSTRSTGLDQIPEALLPMLFADWWLPLRWETVVAATLMFVIADMALSPLLHRMGIRREPH